VAGIDEIHWQFGRRAGATRQRYRRFPATLRDGGIAVAGAARDLGDNPDVVRSYLAG
jgi:hypothetical protein